MSQADGHAVVLVIVVVASSSSNTGRFFFKQDQCQWVARELFLFDV